jgi:hypothetical protein
MATLITMEDGTEVELQDHLHEVHHKGTKGFTEAFLSSMHERLHDHKHEAEHAHSAADLIPRQREAEQ